MMDTHYTCRTPSRKYNQIAGLLYKHRHVPATKYTGEYTVNYDDTYDTRAITYDPPPWSHHPCPVDAHRQTPSPLAQLV